MRDTIKGMFGEAIMERTSQIWDLDEEGELNGCFKPSGYPGVSISAHYSSSLIYASPSSGLVVVI